MRCCCSSHVNRKGCAVCNIECWSYQSLSLNWEVPKMVAEVRFLLILVLQRCSRATSETCAFCEWTFWRANRALSNERPKFAKRTAGPANWNRSIVIKVRQYACYPDEERRVCRYILDKCVYVASLCQHTYSPGGSPPRFLNTNRTRKSCNERPVTVMRERTS